MIIGRLIRVRNYETRVQNGAVCDSACTLIWLAGTSRHLDRRSRLGFHSAGMSWQQRYKRNEPANAAMGAYMAGMGVPQQVIDLQPKADPCCRNYFNYAQAKAWGLLSDRSAKQQALPTPETQQPATAAPASPKPVTTLMVRPTLPEPVPQQALPIPETQQPAAAPKKAQDRIEPGSQQAAIIRGTQQSAAVAQKVVLYEEDTADPNGKRFVGSAIWRTETVTAGLGQPPELAIRADIEVPERKRRRPPLITQQSRYPHCDALDLLLKPPVTKIFETFVTPIQKRPPSIRRPPHVPSRTQTPSAHR